MLKRNAAVLLIAAMVVGVGTYAWAQGAPPGPTTTTTDTAAKQPGHRRMGPLGRAVHGDLIVRAKGGSGFENVSFDRGQVTAASASSITVKRPDGTSVTKAIDANTRFRGVDSADKVKTGKPALVVSKGDKAVLVGQPNPDKPAGRQQPSAAQ